MNIRNSPTYRPSTPSYSNWRTSSQDDHRKASYEYYNQPTFKRSSNRSTMPARSYNNRSQTTPRASRFNPCKNSNNYPSPSSSISSRGTTYSKPWNSTNDGSEFSMNEPIDEDLRLWTKTPPPQVAMKRSSSVSTKSADTSKSSIKDEKKGKPRPKVNFAELITRKMINTFKKANEKDQKKDSTGTEVTSTSRKAPRLPCPGSAPPRIMQEEDRKRMFLKYAKSAAGKSNTIQRMQKDRQKEFSLVSSDRKRPSDSQADSSLAIIDSMLVLSSPTKKMKKDDLSFNSDDVEVLIKNKATGKLATSAEMSQLSFKNVAQSTPQISIKSELNTSSNSSSSEQLIMDADSHVSNDDYSTIDKSKKDPIILDREPSSICSIKKEIINEEDIAKPSTVSLKTEIDDTTYETIDFSKKEQRNEVASPIQIADADTITQEHASTSTEMDVEACTSSTKDDNINKEKNMEAWNILISEQELKTFLADVEEQYTTINTQLDKVLQAKLNVLESGGSLPSYDQLLQCWECCEREVRLKRDSEVKRNEIAETKLSLEKIEQQKDALFKEQRKNAKKMIL